MQYPAFPTLLKAFNENSHSWALSALQCMNATSEHVEYFESLNGHPFFRMYSFAEGKLFDCVFQLAANHTNLATRDIILFMNFLHQFKFSKKELADFYAINNGIFAYEEISLYGGDGFAYLNSFPTLNEDTDTIIQLYLKN